MVGVTREFILKEPLHSIRWSDHFYYSAVSVWITHIVIHLWWLAKPGDGFCLPLKCGHGTCPHHLTGMCSRFWLLGMLAGTELWAMSRKQLLVPKIRAYTLKPNVADLSDGEGQALEVRSPGPSPSSTVSHITSFLTSSSNLVSVSSNVREGSILDYSCQGCPLFSGQFGRWLHLLTLCQFYPCLKPKSHPQT